MLSTQGVDLIVKTTTAATISATAVSDHRHQRPLYNISNSNNNNNHSNENTYSHKFNRTNNNQLSSSSSFNQTQTSSSYLVGDYIQFGCRKGYRMIGSDIITCLHNEQWSSSPPKCK